MAIVGDRIGQIFSENFCGFLLSVILIASPTVGLAKQGDEQYSISPNFTFYYSLYYTKSGPHLNLQRRRDNVRLPIDRMRFLASEVIQKELDISDKAKRILKAVSKKVRDFETVQKWNYFAVPEKVSAKSKTKVSELIQEFNEIDLDKETKAGTLARLDQMRLQFVTLGQERFVKAKNPVDSVKSKLKLSKAQKTEISNLVDEELSSLLKIEEQIEEICKALNSNQSERFKELLSPFNSQNVEQAFALGHCRDLILSKEFEKKNSSVSDKSNFSPWLLGPSIMTFEGRIVVKQDYLYTGSVTSVSKPWRRILDSIRTGEMSWLELTEAQRERLMALRTIEEMEDGRKRVRYAGAFFYDSLGVSPKKNWSAKRYDQWVEKFQDASIQADDFLGDKMMEILLPIQIESLHTSLAVSKCLELGPFHLAEQFLPVLEITNLQRQKIEKMREKRLYSLERAFYSLDGRCRKCLTEEQRVLVKSMYGTPVRLYPSIWGGITK